MGRGAMLGTAVGELIGMIALPPQYSGEGRRTSKLLPKPQEAVSEKQTKPPTNQGILKRLLGIALPVTGQDGRVLLLPAGDDSDQSRLAMAGIATSVATAQYGALQG